MRKPASYWVALSLLLLLNACGGDGSPTSPPAPEDTDLDDDGIVNSVDACPNQPETVNNFADSDGCPDSSLDLYAIVRTDAEQYWQSVFADDGLVYQPISGFTHYSSPISTACGLLGVNNAFYCTVNLGVYYHRELLDFFLLQVGDAAPAVIVAHEIAHHVSNLLGFFALRDLGLVTTKQLELQADCWAGAWVAWVANRGLLETGDLEEAGTALFVVGDPSWEWFNPDGHGIGQQRVAAFLLGLLGGAFECADITVFPAASVTAGEQ
jgi:predicted metalloprotease